MIQKIIKKHTEIEAVRFNGNSNKQDVEEFVGKELKSELESETAYVAGQGAPIFSLLIETKNGIMKAFRGDWIIKETVSPDDISICKNDDFIKKYEFGEDYVSRESINKQAYILMSNINAVKICTNIDDKQHKTLMDSFFILQGMFNEYLKQNNVD